MRARVKRRPEQCRGGGRQLRNDPVSRWHGAGLRLPQEAPDPFRLATMCPMAGTVLPGDSD